MSGRDTGRCNGEREKGKGRKSREQEQTFPTSVALPKYPQWSCGMGKTRSSEHNPDLSSWVQGPCQWSLHCLYWQEPAVKNWSQSQKPWYEIQCLSWHFLMARLDRYFGTFEFILLCTKRITQGGMNCISLYTSICRVEHRNGQYFLNK